VSARAALLRRALPVAVATLLVAFVALRIELGAVAEALRGADWLRYALLAALFTGIWWVLDAWVLSRLVARFHGEVGLREMLRLRGATYLLLPLSYDAAQAALGLLLHRRHAIPLAALAGTLLFYYGVDLLTIAGLGSLGAFLVELPFAEGLRTTLPALLALLAAGLLALRALSRTARAPAWLRRSRLLESLGAAHWRDLGRFVAYRALFYGAFVCFAALSLPAFGIEIPLLALVALVPVIMSLSALPVTVAGIGSTQVLMWKLYGAFGDPPAAVAYSLVYTATLVLCRMPIGLAALWTVPDVWRSGRPQPASCRGR
jgi:uncharacterized membrane protein YbhN (UPF0104 family)